MALLDNLAQGMAGGGSGVPGAPDNPRAAAALATAIVALHAFLRIEQDPQDRAAATQCLAKLESMRGKKLGSPAQAAPAGPPQGAPGGNMPGY